MYWIDSQPGRTAKIDYKEYLFFSGYNYLGLSHIAVFNELVKEGFNRYGWIHPSSRISNTQLKVFTQFEQRLSTLTNCADTVCFPSGFTAGKTVVAAFVHQGEIYTAPDAHPAIQGNENPFDGTYSQWTELLIQTLSNKKAEAVVLILDSVNPLTAEVRDLSFLQHIQQSVICIIDDSHGIGLLGENGAGISDRLIRKNNIDYLITYSLSKAFNLSGGAVSCTNAKHAELLRAQPAYTASTSISPALAFAFLHAQEIYNQQRSQLKQNTNLFKSITNRNLIKRQHSDLPIFLLHPINEDFLKKNNIIISSFAYPDPAGQKIQRIVLNALHTRGDLQALANCLQANLHTS